MSDFPDGYLTTGNKPVINDAYKASEEYLKEQRKQDNLYNDEGDIYESAINNAFMAGAEWQKKQTKSYAVEAESIDYWHQKYLDKVAELDKALDFIVEREKDDDYICARFNKNYDEYQKCVAVCQNLNKDCVLRFLRYHNNKG